MVVGDRLKQLREGKRMSQGDVERRTGLLRCYISRVENGHTVPSLETLEKLAVAFEVPLYRIFYDGEAPAQPLRTSRNHYDQWGDTGKHAQYWKKLRGLLGRTSPRYRSVLLQLARKLESRSED